MHPVREHDNVHRNSSGPRIHRRCCTCSRWCAALQYLHSAQTASPTLIFKTKRRNLWHRSTWVTFFDLFVACARSSTDGVTMGRDFNPPVEVSRLRVVGRRASEVDPGPGCARMFPKQDILNRQMGRSWCKVRDTSCDCEVTRSCPILGVVTGHRQLLMAPDIFLVARCTLEEHQAYLSAVPGSHRVEQPLYLWIHQ